MPSNHWEIDKYVVALIIARLVFITVLGIGVKMAARDGGSVPLHSILITGSKPSSIPAISIDNRGDENESMRIAFPQTRCRRCGLDFDDVDELRGHFRAHHNSSKAAPSSGVQTVDDAGAESDSSDDEHASDADDFDTASEHETSKEHAYGVLPPLIAAIVAERGFVVSAYKALFDPKLLDDAPLGAALELKTSDLVTPGELWLVALYRAGYFAGAVFEMAPSDDPSSKEGNNGPWPRVLVHKRFARYTVRKKQGGSQSAHDASAGRAANSMGAQLRRYNERALIQDIHSLFQSPEWLPLIKQCRRAFVAASKTTTSHLFDGKAIDRGDPRLRRIPFATNRPAFEETIRVANTLNKIRIVCPCDPTKPLPAPTSAVKATEHRAVDGAGGALKSRARDAGASSSEGSAPAVVVSSTFESALVPTVEQKPDDNQPPVAVVSKSKKKKNKRKGNRKTGTLAPAAAGAGAGDSDVSDDDEKAVGGDGDLDELDAAIAAANLEAREASVAAEQRAIVGSLLLETIYDIRSFGAKLGVPPFVLARVLGLGAIEVDLGGPGMSASAASSSQSKPSKGSHAKPAGGISPSDLESARSQLLTLHALLDGSLPRTDVCAAMGWDGIAAAVSVQDAGLDVDWSQVHTEAPLQQNEASSSNANVVRLAKKGKGNKKGSGARDAAGDADGFGSIAVGGGGSATGSRSAGASAASAAPAAAQSNPAPVPAPPAPAVAQGPGLIAERLSVADDAAMGSMSDKDRKRVQMRQAAEARMRSMAAAAGGGVAGNDG